MRILLWHVHGSWTTAFVSGAHEYVVPVDAERSPDGRGRARTWDWPSSVREVPVEELRSVDPDVIVLQRPHELELVRQWLGRAPGEDLSAVYLEHNTPRGDIDGMRHPAASWGGIPVVHVTPFNEAYWDCGEAITYVIEHGIPDPGHRFTGELARSALVVNEPVRRSRVMGTDLVPGMCAVAPVDVFGMRVSGLAAELGVAPERLGEHDDLPQSELHRELPRRRAYLHLARWTSLGLSLLEAMALGMPVVALAATDAVSAVPPGTGVLSTDVGELRRAVRRLVDDPALGEELGRAARAHVLDRYGLGRFLADWDRLLKEVV